MKAGPQNVQTPKVALLNDLASRGTFDANNTFVRQSERDARKGRGGRHRKSLRDRLRVEYELGGRITYAFEDPSHDSVRLNQIRRSREGKRPASATVRKPKGTEGGFTSRE